MAYNTDTPAASIADRFLQDMGASRTQVSIYLANGFQLKGEVVDWDRESILFRYKDLHQIVMRSAVASMYPISDSKRDGEGWWRPYTEQVPVDGNGRPQT